MLSSWVGVALMAGVVVVGLVASLVIGKDGVQRKASIGAFFSLALVLVLFYVLILDLSLVWILPVLIVACILVPLAVYAVVITGLSKREPAHEPRRRSPASGVRPVAVEAAATRRGSVTTAQAKKSTAVWHNQMKPGMAGATPAGSAVLEAPLNEEEHPKPSAQPVRKQRPAVESYDRESDKKIPDETIERGIHSTAAVVCESKPKEQDSFELVSHAIAKGAEPGQGEGSPALELEATPVPEAAPTLEPEAASTPEPELEAAPTPGPEAAPVRTPAFCVDAFTETATPAPSEGSTEVSPDEEPEQDFASIAYPTCLAKADALKENGLFAVAALLYRESSFLAESGSDRRKALFAAMACYVKAEEVSDAKDVASLLQEQADSFNSLEQMKLDAVLRMP